jgi:hypothetical protein
LSIEQHPAFVGCDDAGHDLDERRLARAVFAKHGMNAPGVDDEIGVLQRAHPAVALGNALHDEQAHFNARSVAGRGDGRTMHCDLERARLRMRPVRARAASAREPLVAAPRAPAYLFASL